MIVLQHGNKTDRTSYICKLYCSYSSKLKQKAAEIFASSPNPALWGAACEIRRTRADPFTEAGRWLSNSGSPFELEGEISRLLNYRSHEGMASWTMCSPVKSRTKSHTASF